MDETLDAGAHLLKLAATVLALASLSLCGCRLREATAQSATASATPSAYASARPTSADQGVCTFKNSAQLPKELAAVNEVRITLPVKMDGLKQADVSKNTARIKFFGSNGEQAALAMDQGLDLYDRSGSIVLVSGAKTGPAPDYALQFSFKLSLSSDSGSAAGFAVLNGPSGEKVAAMTCRWQPRTDVNVSELEANFFDGATQNPDPEQGAFQLTDAPSPALCH